MPFLLIFIGLLVLVTAVRGTTRALASLLIGDVLGTGGFLYWMVSVLIIGFLGYIKPIKPVSDAFLALLVLVLFLSPQNKGFFTQFNAAIAQVGKFAQTASQASTNLAAGPAPLTTGLQGNSNLLGNLQQTSSIQSSGGNGAMNPFSLGGTGGGADVLGSSASDLTGGDPSLAGFNFGTSESEPFGITSNYNL